MKSPLHISLSLAALLAANSLAAQVASEPAAAAPAAQPGAPNSAVSAETPATIEQNGQKFYLISTIKTIQANHEFQTNVQIVQSRRDFLIELHRRKEQAITTPEKEALQWNIEEVGNQLKSEDQQMQKTYGFSITRNYMVQIIKSRIYAPISDEDYNKLSEADRTKPDHIISRPFTQEKDGKPVTASRRLVYHASIDGVVNNDTFRQEAQQFQALRNRAGQLTQLLNQVKTPEDKQKVSDALLKTDADIQKSSDELLKKYGFNLSIKDWTLEIEEASLYTPISDEEMKRAEENQKKAEAEKAKTAPATPAPKP
jgi:hypothetical protein